MNCFVPFFLKLVLYIFKDSSLKNCFIVECQQGNQILFNSSSNSPASANWPVNFWRCPFNITNTKKASFPITSSFALLTGSYWKQVLLIILLKIHLYHCPSKDSLRLNSNNPTNNNLDYRRMNPTTIHKGTKDQKIKCCLQIEFTINQKELAFFTSESMPKVIMLLLCRIPIPIWEHGKNADRNNHKNINVRGCIFRS